MELIIWISVVISLFLIIAKEAYIKIAINKNIMKSRNVNNDHDCFVKTIKPAIFNAFGFIINSSIFLSVYMLSGIIQTLVDSNGIVEKELRNIDVNNHMVSILVSIIVLGTLILNIYFCTGFINSVYTIIKTKTYRKNNQRSI